MSRFALRSHGLLLALLLALLGATDLPAQVSLSSEHRRIDFLAGEWQTTSEFPDGSVAQGELSYRWVLGGAWMRVEFSGDPPGGGIWEAHVMQRWNPEEEAYEAWVFGGDGPPLLYRGTSEGPGHFRVEYVEGPGTVSGIDYRHREDGSVYQENWIVEDGARRVTLRTTYQPLR